MLPIVDYHMHTPLCGHATGDPSEYAEQALARGLKEIGFSDHAPFIQRPLPGITMSDSELPHYIEMIRSCQRSFADRLTIRLGIEADFIPGCEEKTRDLLAQHPFDYVYGSVHFINDWGFDNPDERIRWNQADINETYRLYYKLLRAAAQSQLFDIMAHVDLVKKFGHRPTVDLHHDLAETARVFKASGVAIEINTAGLRKDVQEIYPSLEVLRFYVAAGVPVTFGSDAHRPEEVGLNFSEARSVALAAGCREYVLFRDRRIDRVMPLT